jgi:hypothetical protein
MGTPFITMDEKSNGDATGTSTITPAVISDALSALAAHRRAAGRLCGERNCQDAHLPYASATQVITQPHVSPRQQAGIERYWNDLE